MYRSSLQTKAERRESTREKKPEVYVGLIDLEKADDGINREAL